MAENNHGRKSKRNSELSGSDTLNNVAQRARELIARGNARRVVIRASDGRQLFEVSLTVAVAILVGVFILIPGGMFFLGLAAVIGIIARVRIEILRELTEADDVVEMQFSQGDQEKDESGAE